LGTRFSAVNYTLWGKALKKILGVCALLLLASSAWAIDAGRKFDDPEKQAMYDKIINEVRCLKCQNQTIKDSNAFLAADLRREIRRLLDEGKTENEVYDFLVARYGEFALYRPRFSGKTLILWIAPFILLALGGLTLTRVIRRRMALPIGDESIEEDRA
jgi:cytochrome c-type biogenesis protein CcmH